MRVWVQVLVWAHMQVYILSVVVGACAVDAGAGMGAGLDAGAGTRVNADSDVS